MAPAWDPCPLRPHSPQVTLVSTPCPGFHATGPLPSSSLSSRVPTWPSSLHHRGTERWPPKGTDTCILAREASCGASALGGVKCWNSSSLTFFGSCSSGLHLDSPFPFPFRMGIPHSHLEWEQRTNATCPLAVPLGGGELLMAICTVWDEHTHMLRGWGWRAYGDLPQIQFFSLWERIPID